MKKFKFYIIIKYNQAASKKFESFSKEREIVYTEFIHYSYVFFITINYNLHHDEYLNQFLTSSWGLLLQFKRIRSFSDTNRI